MNITEKDLLDIFDDVASCYTTDIYLLLDEIKSLSIVAKTTEDFVKLKTMSEQLVWTQHNLQTYRMLISRLGGK